MPVQRNAKFMCAPSLVVCYLATYIISAQLVPWFLRKKRGCARALG